MKLLELIEPIDVNKELANRESVSNLINAVSDFMGGTTEQIGRGAFSIVYSSENSPHEVFKVGYVKLKYLKNDAYLAYIKSIMNSGMASNPYFPRIYAVKFLVDEDNTSVKYFVEMEKLEPFYTRTEHDEHNIELFYNLGRRMFTDFHVSSNSAEMIVNRILLNIINYLNGLKAVEFNDPQLKQALDLISRVVKKSRTIKLDIDQSNVMLRRGKYGLQLVFTDPVKSPLHFSLKPGISVGLK